MRKKYDEMRRIGISQDQYKYQEAYRRQYGSTYVHLYLCVLPMQM